MSDSPVSLAVEGAVVTARLDDGKVNAVSHEVLEALHAALDRAEKEGAALALLGREGTLCAGFHLDTMRAGVEPMRELVAGGAELLLRMAASPAPVVTGATGHALAMGALLLLASDLRIGAAGDFKIGLNEVAIGMTLPWFAVEIASARLSRRHLSRAVLGAEIHAPEAARDAGFLDRVVPQGEVAAATAGEAARLAELPRRAFGETKARLWGDMVERARATLAEDRATWGSPVG